MTEVYTHRSASFNCPHCGKVCDTNTGTASDVTDNSIGICVDCTQAFWLCVESREPLALRARKITGAEYASFNEAELEAIVKYQNFLKDRKAAKNETKKHAAFLRITAQIAEEFDIDIATMLLMFAYYPLPAFDLDTDPKEREYAAAMFARYSELCAGVLEDGIEYAVSVFSVAVQLRSAADFVSRS